jgi:methylenetetrahydrofolate dehydrogenase (NADP+)/methenyltetrahydrofolate cyclohydrolase
MELLDGLQTSKKIKQEIAAEVAQLKAAGKKIPHLAAVLIGDNGASLSYVGNKVKSCQEVGFNSTLIHKSAETTEVELLEIIQQLNSDDDIDGYIVQLPLPKHINEQKVLLAIDPAKDVDGFHPENVGRMTLDLPGFLPATPAGIVELLKRYNVPTEGKNCLVIGRSHIVGLPMSILMQRNTTPGNCTVTIAHSRTKDLKKLAQEADIIIAALGKPEFVTADMVKEGAVVVDVGITRVDDASKKSGFRLAGDVKFDEVAPKCSYITPVPGGVGPMTIKKAANIAAFFYFINPKINYSAGVSVSPFDSLDLLSLEAFGFSIFIVIFSPSAS